MDKQTDLLGRMFEAAIDNDKDKVLDLNKQFDKIHLQEKPGMDPDLALELDRIRQSCVGAVTMPGLHDTFINDGRDRLAVLDPAIDVT